jgi:hypothetical protein
MDRYCKAMGSQNKTIEISDLHIMGVTCMFLASKFEDIIPLKMKTIFEKIGHQKLEPAKIRSLELVIMKAITYNIHTPTVLDFLKTYLVEVLDIHLITKT